MDGKKLTRLLVLGIVVAVADVVAFSPGLLKLSLFSGGMASMAIAWAVAVLSVAGLLLGSMTILAVEKTAVAPKTEEDVAEDLKQAILRLSDKEVFRANIAVIADQMERFSERTGTIRDLLLQKFNENEISYLKFVDVLNVVKKVFYTGIRSVTNKVYAFDDEDYRKLTQGSLAGTFSESLIQTKLSVYREYIAFVNTAVEQNEEIILKLDRLLLETSKLDSFEVGDVESMPAIRELDALTSQAKLYK